MASCLKALWSTALSSKARLSTGLWLQVARSSWMQEAQFSARPAALSEPVAETIFEQQEA